MWPWRQPGDILATTWRQPGDNLATTWLTWKQDILLIKESITPMWGINLLLNRYKKSSSTGTIWFKELSRKCGRKVSILAWEPGGQQNQDTGDKFITLTSLTELAPQASDPEPSTSELACESSHCHLKKEVNYQNTNLRTNICHE